MYRSPQRISIPPFFFKDYTEELYKQDLHDPDNHDGVITQLEPDILECEVKWALESITMYKASGGDGIPVVRKLIEETSELEGQLDESEPLLFTIILQALSH